MAFLMAIIGLFIGSFLNVLAERIPKNEDVIWGRSHCDSCAHTLSWYELIPVLSFMFQQGKTRCCHKTLSIQYPLTEIISGCAFGILWLFSQPTVLSNPLQGLLDYFLSLVIFSSLFVVFITDLKHQLIPMEMIIITFVAGLIRLFMVSVNFTSPTYFQTFFVFVTSMGFISHVLSASVVGFFFFCLWFFSKGKAMGEGDIYVSAVLAFLLGFPTTFVFFYTAFLTGAGVGVILVLRKKKSLKTQIAFGPFLIFGYVIAAIWGQVIISALFSV